MRDRVDFLLVRQGAKLNVLDLQKNSVEAQKVRLLFVTCVIQCLLVYCNIAVLRV